MCDGTLVNQLLEKIKALEERNKLLAKRIEELERLLKRHENSNTPPSRSCWRRELIPEDQKKSPGQKPGHPGASRPYPDPDETVTATAESCGHCGHMLDRPAGYERRLIEDIPKPVQAKVTEYLLARYVCAQCGRETVAEHPDCPPDSRFGKNLQSQITAMKYRLRLPYRKIAEALRQQHGLDISAAAVLGMVGRTAQALRPGYLAIRVRIRQAQVVYADETSIRVDGQTWWIWVFVAGRDVLVVISDSRGRDVIEQALGQGFKGIIVCDGWKPYRSFTDSIQRCWAHLLREADFIARKEPEAAKLAAALHRMFDVAAGMLEENPPPEERKELQRRLRRWMGIWMAREYDSPAVQKFARKIANGFGHWFTFVTSPGVEPTNNIAERALRESVVQRKIIGTLRNAKGVFAHETVMSCFATWENRGLDMYQEMGRFL